MGPLNHVAYKERAGAPTCEWWEMYDVHMLEIIDRLTDDVEACYVNNNYNSNYALKKKKIICDFRVLKYDWIFTYRQTSVPSGEIFNAYSRWVRSNASTLIRKNQK